MPIPDLLEWLQTQDLEGVLTVDSGITQFKFFMSQGAIVRAQTNTKNLSLGQFLIAMRTLSEDSMRHALEVRQEVQVRTNTRNSMPIGEFLIQHRLISEEELKLAIISQIKEVLFEAATWKKGVFVFERDKFPNHLFVSQASVSLETLCRLIKDRQEAWHHFHQMFGDKKARLEIGRVSSDNKYRLDHLEDRILSYAAFGMTVEAILLEVRGPAFQTYQRLTNLVQLGFIEIIGAAVDEPPTLDIPIQNEATINHEIKAEKAFSAGDYRLAMSYANVCLARDPNDERARNIIYSADKLLKEQLRGLLPSLEAVPHKLITIEQLRARRRISAKEYYLLTRINGIRNIDAIVRISPMKDIDAYKLFEQLKREGVLRFELG
ncbi:MAG: DUF4388 domain-containing protein [Myxococcota bacterium]|nr:DUF4388 domain-containing protein [Myxococcota bacterium]